MKRPALFAIEVVAAMLLASAGAWLVERVNHKANRQAQAQERAAAAEERIASALESRGLLAEIPPIPHPNPAPCDDYNDILAMSEAPRHTEVCSDMKDAVASKPLNLPGYNH
jgi:hypothetical protein